MLFNKIQDHKLLTLYSIWTNGKEFENNLWMYFKVIIDEFLIRSQFPFDLLIVLELYISAVLLCFWTVAESLAEVLKPTYSCHSDNLRESSELLCRFEHKREQDANH